MADTMRKPFCDLCEMPGGRHVFGCPADDGVYRAPKRSNSLPFAVFDEFGKGADDRVDDAIHASHEAGRQLGMEQARVELAKTSEAVERIDPPAPYRCIAPECVPHGCSDCNMAQPTDEAKMAVLEAAVGVKAIDEREVYERMEGVFWRGFKAAAVYLKPRLQPPQPAAERVAPLGAWVPMHERAPEPDTDCVVFLRYSLDRPPFIATDRWEMQSEDPTGMGGPPMETGYGWRDNFESDVIAWKAVGELPPETWDQRLPDGIGQQAKEQT